MSQGLINADNKIEPEEADLLNRMVRSFQLDNEVVEKIELVTKKLQDVYDDVYTAIFDQKLNYTKLGEKV